MLATEAMVRSIRKPPEFAATSSFRPLEHYEALDAVTKAMADVSLIVDHSPEGDLRKRFTVADKQAKMAAVLPLVNPIDEFCRMQVAILNSWNKTLAMRVGFGAEVFVCCNGSVFASEVIGRKHTTNILADLPHLLNQALSKVNEYADHQRRFFARLREVELSDVTANDFIVRAAIDHGCVTEGEIVHVVRQWRDPAHDEFKPRTAWSLHNAFTEVGKRIERRNGNVHAERSVRLSGLFADTFASDLRLPATRRVA